MTVPKGKPRCNPLAPYLAAALVSAVGSAGASPALQVIDASAPPGGEARMTVSLNPVAAGVCGLTLTLIYEAAVPATAPPLEFVSPGTGGLAPPFDGSLYAAAGVFNPATTLPYDYRRRIVVVHGEPVDGPADVLRLPFKVPTAAAVGTVYTVTVKADGFDDVGRKTVLEDAEAKVIVGGFRPGDVDGNGQTDVQDAILILRHAAGIEALATERQGRADLDGNGQVDVADAVGVLRRAVGLEG